MTPEPKSIGDFLIVIGFLASVGVNLATLIRGARPQKREVSLTDGFVTQTEMNSICERLEKVEQQVEDIRGEMKRDMQVILESSERRATAVHERVNQVLVAVSEVRGALHERGRADI